MGDGDEEVETTLQEGKKQPPQVPMPIGKPITVFTKRQIRFDAVDEEVTRNRRFFRSAN
jgi:hypothetical protein